MVNPEIIATGCILATRQTSWIQKSFLRKLNRVSSINNYGSSFPSRTGFRPQGTNRSDRNDVLHALFSTELVAKPAYNSDLSPQIGKTKFHKSHQFDYRNDVSVYVGEAKSGIGK